MKPIDWIASKLGYLKLDERSTAALIGAVTGSSLIAPDRNWTQLVDAYKSWVYTSIDKIAKAVAMIPLHLYVYRRHGKKVIDPGLFCTLRMIKMAHGAKEVRYYLKQVSVEREEVEDHPFLDLIHTPNAIMTRFMLWYETMIRLELGGLCGWLLLRDGLAVPRGVWPLPLTKTATLNPKVTPRMEIEYWEYKDGSVNERFKTQDILLFKYPHPASPFQAMSPLMSQTYPYDIDLFLAQQQRALFENMAIPGLNLVTEQRMNKETVKEIKEQITEQHGGPLRAGRTLILHSGLKSDKLGQTAREAMIRDVAKYAREKLITAHDLSEGKLGLVQDVNRANMEALNETFYQDCLRPKCMLIEEVIESFLLPAYDRGLTCDFELPYIEDLVLKLAERKQNIETMYSTVNQEREKDGLEPVPWGDVPWIPLMLQPWTPELQSGEKPEPEPKPTGDEDEEMMDDGKKVWDEQRKTTYWKVFVGRTARYEQMLLPPMKAIFKQQRAEVLQRLDEEGKRLQGLYTGWSRQKIEEHLKGTEYKALDRININKKQEEKRTRVVVTPFIRAIVQDVGAQRMKELLEAVKFNAFFNSTAPEVLEWIGERMVMFSRAVTNNTFDQIRALLREATVEGASVTEIAFQLEEKFESWDKYRAPLIARTETIAAYNQADLFAVEQSGVGEKLLKHWLSARDGAVRDTHRAADRSYARGIEVNEPFKVGDDSMQAPGEGTDPSENINCRCTLYYSQKEET